ncbi:MAG: radical SAM protein, partial [Armatimonadetes bacterium]|nr:radical SAM protein [Armatimonadota bacterium]
MAIVSMYDIENNATRILAAGARRAGHRVIEIFFKDWINNGLLPPTQKELDHLVWLLRQHNVDLAAISIRASAYHKVVTRLTEEIRSRVNIPVIWGGTHVILSPEACIQIADMICVGEGDLTVIDVLDGIARGEDLSTLNNVWLRRGDTVVRNAVQNLVGSLDELPFRDYTSPDKYWIHGDRVIQGDPMVNDPVFQVMCSRGCVFVCSYCYNSQLARDVFRGKGKYYRFRSVSNVIEEINRNRSVFKNMRRVKFDDEVFVFEKKWLEEFIERYPREVGLPFEAFIEPKLVEPEIFRRLKEAGLSVIYMGVQNTHRVNEEIFDRHVPEQRIRNAVQLFHEIKLDYRIQVIVDDPLSQDEDRAHLFNFLLEFPRPFELYLFSMVVFPNTELARKLLAANIITEKDIEGENTKTFQQMRVSLNWPRPPDERFWCCMMVLLTKNFLPKGLLRWLS